MISVSNDKMISTMHRNFTNVFNEPDPLKTEPVAWQQEKVDWQHPLQLVHREPCLHVEGSQHLQTHSI